VVLSEEARKTILVKEIRNEDKKQKEKYHNLGLGRGESAYLCDFVTGKQSSTIGQTDR
jgi:hypothetical protein